MPLKHRTVAKSTKKPVTAFVMMKVAPGRAQETAAYLKDWAEASTKRQKSSAYLKGAWVVTGNYDVVAMAEADTNRDLLQLVTDLVNGTHHSSTTIISTTTMIAEDSFW